MKSVISAFLIGALFGLGLAVAEMTDPARVIGFLDVAGRWDATLLLVMGAALAVSFPLFPLVLKRPHPLLAATFALPTATRLDARLVLGAALFGVGWGLAGLCPGPALANLASGSRAVVLFVIAMIGGQWLAGRIRGSAGTAQGTRRPQ
jgi:uncharacterized membrane protein YedE/YeeE